MTSAQLSTLYREMHAKGPSAGVAWKSVYDAFTAAVPDTCTRLVRRRAAAQSAA